MAEYPWRTSSWTSTLLNESKIRSNPLEACLDIPRVRTSGILAGSRAFAIVIHRASRSGDDEGASESKLDLNNESCRIRNIIRSAARIPVRQRPLDGRL